MTSTVEDGVSELRELPDGHAGQSGGEPTEGGKFPLNPGKLANIDPAPILRRIQAGESLRTIARDIGVSNVGLRAWLLREDGEAYRDVITSALTTRVAEADEELETASDPISIARSREVARFARMDLERRRPHLYGVQKQQLNISGNQIRVEIVDFSQQSAAALPDNTYSPDDTDGK